MKLDLARIEARARWLRLSGMPRIIPAKHASTPASAGFGSSRFSSPTRAFRVLYAAEDFETAFAEVVIRDRFQNRLRRVLFEGTLATLRVTEIGSSAALKLLDVTGPAAYELGIDTDVSRARSHEQGQAFAEALHAGTDFDGLVFDSRLTAKRCVAIFDRALVDVHGARPVDLTDITALAAELKRLRITIRRKQGLGTL